MPIYPNITPRRFLDKYQLIKRLSNGLGSSSVLYGKTIHNKEVVIKQCLDKGNYQREKHTLLLLDKFIYTPKLIDFSDRELYIVTEWCGNDMRNISGSAKKAYAPHVKKIVDMLYQKYGLHHNDIRWKNLTYKNYKITVIDWENASTENLDLNHDNIL